MTARPIKRCGDRGWGKNIFSIKGADRGVCSLFQGAWQGSSSSFQNGAKTKLLDAALSIIRASGDSAITVNDICHLPGCWWNQKRVPPSLRE